MTAALWILLGIAVLLTALNLLRVGVDAEFDGETFFLRAKAGPLNISILPKKVKPEKPKKPKKEKKKPAKPPEEQPKTKTVLPDLSTLLKLARLALEAVGAFRRKLQVDLLRLHLLVASDDPYDTAMNYARIRAGLNGLYPLAARTLSIRERDIRLSADFTKEKTRAAARLILTIRIGQIVGIALVFACKALPLLLPWLKARLQQKKKTKNRAGKAPAERTVSNG